MGKWLYNPIAKQIVLVLDEVHITRILNEGGYEVPSPVETVPVVEEQANAVVSTPKNNKRKPTKRVSKVSSS